MSRLPSPWTHSLALLLMLTCVPLALAEPPTTPVESSAPAGVSVPAAPQTAGSFLRVLRDERQQPTSLDTAIVSFTPASGEGELVVDLVGVVHMADRRYYRKLNRQLDKYDVVLYELVAPQGTGIPKGGRDDSDNPLAMIQKMGTVLLELESQMDHIDYSRPHFVHADMSPEDMARTIRERGDDEVTLLLGITADMLRQQNLRELQQQRSPPPPRAPPVAEEDPFAMLLDPDRAKRLKQMMAEQFDQMDATGGLGNTLNTILVADRNQAALRVLQTELAKGKKRIAIFYGAAHMPDFEKRLTTEFGLKRADEKWLTAWDLTRRGKSGLETLFKLLE